VEINRDAEIYNSRKEEIWKELEKMKKRPFRNGGQLKSKAENHILQKCGKFENTFFSTDKFRLLIFSELLIKIDF
jgi:hypothetical protein